MDSTHLVSSVNKYGNIDKHMYDEHKSSAWLDGMYTHCQEFFAID